VLAAAALVRLGYRRACDVIGGFGAWRSAGLPTAPAPALAPTDELPGMRGPD
jgi:rhodanese-related sulfurtransferase